MTVETDEANAIYAFSAQLFAIYAQSNNENAGALTAISTHEGNGAGAIATMSNPIIINGGYITAKCTSTRSDVTTGYAGIAGKITINGGNIVATSASKSRGSGMQGAITIGYNNPNFSLVVSGFNGNCETPSGFGGSLTIASEKTLKYTDDDNVVHELSGTFDGTSFDETVGLNKLIAGKTLRPATAYKLSVDNNLRRLKRNMCIRILRSP